MSSIFHDINFQKTDLNTRKELEEDCWRKAENEELQAFLGFYIEKNGRRGGVSVVIVITALIFFVLAGELFFELMFRSDSSYNPLPIAAAIIMDMLLLLFLLCIRELSLRKNVKALENCIYVTDAIAYGKSDNKVQVMVNKKKIAFDEYKFEEAVSPTDYVYQEGGSCLGFRVLLYAVIQNKSCVMKAVLGSYGYRHFAERFKRFIKIK